MTISLERESAVLGGRTIGSVAGPASGQDAAEVVEVVYQSALRVARRQSAAVVSYAEDIAMEVVLAFLETTDEVTSPAGWAATRARFLSTNVANRKVRRAAELVWLDEGDGIDIWSRDPNHDPYRVVAGAEAYDRVRSVLSAREQEVLRLVAEGYSHDEIAQELGYASNRVVTTTVSRARRKVLDAFSEAQRRELFDLHACLLSMDIEPEPRAATPPEPRLPDAMIDQLVERFRGEILRERIAKGER